MLQSFYWAICGSAFTFAVSPPERTVLGFYSTQAEYVQMVTALLDGILDGYDRSLRPGLSDGKPVLVLIDIHVHSMGPISEQNMAFSMDCYFRQTWRDNRLRFTAHSNTTLVLGLSMLDKIWKPDTYFWNERNSFVHTLTVPNKFVRLAQDGTINFSSRLTIRANCPMLLNRYPLDVQWCSLIMGSFGYAREDILYAWKFSSEKSVQLIPELQHQMAQFSLVDMSVTNYTTHTNHGARSILEVSFSFHRRFGYYLINFYGPCTLIVILSWVAFFINREATADRIALGIYSILTMTFLGLEVRADLPRVGYATALDVYLLLSNCFIVGTIVEFALVHAFTKRQFGDPDVLLAERRRAPLLEDEPSVNNCARFPCYVPPSSREDLRTMVPLLEMSDGTDSPTVVMSPIPYRNVVLRRFKEWTLAGKKSDPADPEVNSVSAVDRLARILFPSLFAVASLIYWTCYLRM